MIGKDSPGGALGSDEHDQKKIKEPETFHVLREGMEEREPGFLITFNFGSGRSNSIPR